MASANDIKAGRAFVELYGDRSLLTKDLDAARAQVNRWQAEQARVARNIAKATAAGDTGRAAGQQGRLAGIQERIATSQQEAAGRAALAKRLAAHKAITAQARAQAAATPLGQLQAAARSQATVVKSAKAGASQFERMGAGVIKFGIAVEAAKGAVAAIGIATAAARGEWDQVSALVKRLPFGLGEVASLTEEVMMNISGAREEMEKFQKTVSRNGEYVAGMETLGGIEDAAKFDARLSGMDDEGKRIAQLQRKRDQLVEQIRKTPGSKLARRNATDAVNAAFEAAKNAPGGKKLKETATALDKLYDAMIKGANLREGSAGKNPIDAELEKLKAAGADKYQLAAASNALRAAQSAEAKVSVADEMERLNGQIDLATGKATELDAAMANIKIPGATPRQLMHIRSLMGKLQMAEFAMGENEKLRTPEQDLADYREKLVNAADSRMMTRAAAGAAWGRAIGERINARGVTGSSAAAIQSLQAGPSMDAMTKAAQETAKNTRKLVESGGPKFG